MQEYVTPVLRLNHNARASKDRTGLFGDDFIKIDEQTGQQLADWLNTGRDVDAEKKEQAETLKQEATQYAEKGVEAYKSFFTSLDNTQRALLAPYHEDLKATAQERDAMQTEDSHATAN